MTSTVLEIKVLALVLALVQWAAWMGDGDGGGSVAPGLLGVRSRTTAGARGVVPGNGSCVETKRETNKPAMEVQAAEGGYRPELGLWVGFGLGLDGASSRVPAARRPQGLCTAQAAQAAEATQAYTGVGVSNCWSLRLRRRRA